jgi:hypothetical protein
MLALMDSLAESRCHYAALLYERGRTAAVLLSIALKKSAT